MTQAIPKITTFEEFLHFKPENRQVVDVILVNPKQPTISIYQLVDGEY